LEKASKTLTLLLKTIQMLLFFYGGSDIDNGHETIKVSRRDANDFSFKIKEEGWPKQKFNFERRTFRVWTLIVSIPLGQLLFLELLSPFL